MWLQIATGKVGGCLVWNTLQLFPGWTTMLFHFIGLICLCSRHILKGDHFWPPRIIRTFSFYIFFPFCENMPTGRWYDFRLTFFYFGEYNWVFFWLNHYHLVTSMNEDNKEKQNVFFFSCTALKTLVHDNISLT